MTGTRTLNLFSEILLWEINMESDLWNCRWWGFGKSVKHKPKSKDIKEFSAGILDSQDDDEDEDQESEESDKGAMRSKKQKKKSSSKKEQETLDCRDMLDDSFPHGRDQIDLDDYIDLSYWYQCSKGGSWWPEAEHPF